MRKHVIIMDRKLYAIILAGGDGKRMGTKVAKQFLELEGKPILRHTIEQFLSLPFEIEIIVVLPQELKKYWKDYCTQNDFLPKYFLPSGGITRFHSVQNALKFIPDGSLVAVHDGVRPFVSTQFLIGLFEQAKSVPALIPAIKPVESIREIDKNGNSFSVDREKFLLVQTPQIFHSEVLVNAYKQAFSPKFTDDASVVEAYGCNIRICQGSRYNIKITTPEDLEVAKSFMFILKDKTI